jgi:hypothetical protein
MKSASEIRAAWLAQLHSTAPTNRPRAEAAMRTLYAAAGFPEPRHLFWFESPCAASWPVTVLVAEGDRALTPLLAPSALSTDDKGRPERTRAEVATLLGVSDWKAAVAAVGASRIGTLQVVKDPARLFSMAFLNARYEGVDDISALFKRSRTSSAATTAYSRARFIVPPPPRPPSGIRSSASTRSRRWPTTSTASEIGRRRPSSRQHGRSLAPRGYGGHSRTPCS